MGFVAADAVIELDYDFRGLRAGKRIPGWPEELNDVRGVSPEPSQEQVAEFQEGLRRVYKLGEFADGAEEGDGERVTGQQLAEQVNRSLSRTELTKRDEEVAGLYAAVCSHEPSAAQICALPARHRVAFIGYLSNELLNPTSGSAATNGSRAPLRSV